MVNKSLQGELNFVLIGAKSTGKTVYLTKLSMQSQISAKDPTTINYLKPFKQKLLNGEIIDATAAQIINLIFNYNDGEFNNEFQIDDYDGKFVEQLSSEGDEDAKNNLLENIQESEGILFFLPYEKRIDNSKMGSVRDEVDRFIDEVKKLYPNHKQLPIPVVIAVTKWDDSEYFQAENEQKAAVNYINNNIDLKNITQKIQNYFKNTKIVPLSSYKDYNLLEPIRFFLSTTFNIWETKINELRKDEKELLVFLNDILYDVQHYKNGEYKKLYLDLENKIFQGIQTDLEKMKSYNEFLEYKNENQQQLSVLTDDHKEIIFSIENKLRSKKQMKNILSIISAVIIVAISIFGYMKYQSIQKEKVLYTNIQKAYDNSNYNNFFHKVIVYKEEFPKYSVEHLKTIASMENELISKCQKEITSLKNAIINSKSLEKNYQLSTQVKEQSKLCGIESDEFIENESTILKQYKDTKESIAKLILESITQDAYTNVAAKINNFTRYDEYGKLKELLQQHIYSLVDAALESEDIDKVQNFYEVVSIAGIDEDRKQQLKEKMKNLKEKNQFEELISELNTITDYSEAKLYVENNWEDNHFYNQHKSKVLKLLKNKFNEDINKRIGNMEDSILTDADFRSLKNKIYETDTIINKKNYVKNINIEVKLTPLNSNNFNEKMILYLKYNSVTVIPVRIKLSATSSNNSIFTCDNTAELELKIETPNHRKISYVEEKDDKDNCKNLTMSFYNNEQYREGFYKVKATDYSWVNESTNGDFTLTKNDVIKLRNGESVEKNFNEYYTIKLQGK